MKSIVVFLKTTIVGGIVFLVPVVLILIVLGKAFELTMKLAQPLARFIPLESLYGFAMANIIGLLMLAIICFFAGLIARTSLANKAVQKAESGFLWQIPGYSFAKGITDSLGNHDEPSALQPVLARLDDCWQIAFEVERMADGRVVVYLPGAPNPWSGSVMLIGQERIEPLNASMMGVAGNLRKLGRGFERFVQHSSSNV